MEEQRRHAGRDKAFGCWSSSKNSMQLSDGFWKDFQPNESISLEIPERMDSIISNRRQGSPCPMQVTNLTRQTLLANCVTLADRGPTRRRGLLGRHQLAVGEGLWIVPCEAVHTFGMQFSIDLVYMDRDHRIIKIRSDVPPWRLSVCLSAHSVLELAAGVVHDSQTRAGDRLHLQFDRSQQ